jgi:hypothetical protein
MSDPRRNLLAAQDVFGAANRALEMASGALSIAPSVSSLLSTVTLPAVFLCCAFGLVGCPPMRSISICIPL